MGENFRELVEKWNFTEKIFVDCSLAPTVLTELSNNHGEKNFR